MSQDQRDLPKQREGVVDLAFERVLQLQRRLRGLDRDKSGTGGNTQHVGLLSAGHERGGLPTWKRRRSSGLVAATDAMHPGSGFSQA